MNVKHATIHSYWLMFVATVITVGIVTSSQLVTNRISLLLDRQASELLAADLVILSGKKFDAEYRAAAREQGLLVSQSVSLRTAIFIDDEPQLVELKAVDAAYPLRGKLERAHELTAQRSYAEQGPPVGEVWLDSKLAPSVGQDLTLGEQAFAASWLLTYEPDRGGAIFNLAPRVLMNIEDLAKTGLVVPGSRVRYRLMFAGDQADIARFKTWLTINLKPGEEVQGLENARPEMRRALERTRKFFALAIILTLVIAMAAIAITARYTANREASKIAMLRAFGISQRSLFKYYLGQLGRLWIAATVVGVMLGWATQFPLQWALDGWFGRTLPQVYSLRPYLTAALVGLLALAGFSLPYLLNATATPPMQVLRTVVNRRSWSRGLLITGSAIIAIFCVLVILMQSSLLAIAVLGIVLACAFILPLILGWMVKLLLVSSRRRFWLRQYLLSRLQASSRGAIYVMSGFSLVLIAILLIAVVKDELMGEWQAQLPDDIPNYFLINIRSNDVAGIEEFLRQRQIEASTPYALVRARMSQINGVDVDKISFSHPRGSHSVTHTFNITYADELPDQNKIVAGHWLSENRDPAQFSVEEGMAERLGLKLGDQLTMTVG
ncbi:MAG: FtsX-like permease family protein, partial [Gammaproteobacteria bacterium]